MMTLTQEVSQLVSETTNLHHSLEREKPLWAQQQVSYKQVLQDSVRARPSLRLELYVNSQTGDDTKSGTSANPLRTLDHALSRINNTSFRHILIYLRGTADHEITQDFPNLNACVVNISGHSVVEPDGTYSFLSKLYRRDSARSGTLTNCFLRFNFVKYVDECQHDSLPRPSRALFQFKGGTLYLGTWRSQARAENTSSFVFDSQYGAPLANSEGGRLMGFHTFHRNNSTNYTDRAPVIGRAFVANTFGSIYVGFTPMLSSINS